MRGAILLRYVELAEPVERQLQVHHLLPAFYGSDWSVLAAQRPYKPTRCIRTRNPSIFVRPLPRATSLYHSDDVLRRFGRRCLELANNRTIA